MTDHHHNPDNAEVLREILEQQHLTNRLLHQLHRQGEELIMALNAQAQAIVDSNNTVTNKIADAVTSVADAITAGTQAIVDLAAKVVAGTIDPAELTAALQPSVDKLNAAGDTLVAGAAALKLVATTNDPAITPGAPPIVIPPAV